MATQFETLETRVIPFITDPEVIRRGGIQPFGQLIHSTGETGVALDAAAAANDLLVLTYPLPTNFAFRLTHFTVNLDSNDATNNWVRDPHFKMYYQGDSGPYTQIDYPCVVTAVSNVGVRYYTPGYQSGNPMFINESLSNPTYLTRQVPAGVGALDPQFRVTASGASTAGSIQSLAIWEMYNLEQQNHAALNTSIPVAF